MLNKSMIKNVLYNVTRKLISIIFPFITYSYVTRIFGSSLTGRVSYTASIANFMGVLASFGITSYGAREGARCRDDRRKLSDLASRTFEINIVLSVIIYSIMIGLVYLIDQWHDYPMLMLVQGLSVFFMSLSLEWINLVFEDYKFIAIRSFFINCFMLVMTLILVKKPEDYLVYVLLGALCNILICFMNFIYCKRYIDIHIQSFFHCFSLLRGMATFFINELAILIYVNSDVIMLGAFIGEYSVGIYSVAVKIYTIIKTLLAAFYSVSVARLSYLYFNEKHKDYKNMVNRVVSGELIILLPICMGVMKLSDELVVLVGGRGFIESGFLLRILSFSLLFAILGGMVTNCVNIPMGKERLNMKVTIVSATLNIVLNIPFIILYGNVGAAITTMISELLVFVLACGFNKDVITLLKMNEIARSALIGCVGCALVWGVCDAIDVIINIGYVKIIVSVLLSSICYFVLLTVIGIYRRKRRIRVDGF